MGSNAREYNQENLVEVEKRLFRKILEKINQNYFLDLTSGANWSADRFGARMKLKDQYLYVEHFISKPEGGLKLVYKVDKDIHNQFLNEFGDK